MSQGKRTRSRDELPLPAPKSPDALDDKILSYARRMAPGRRSVAPRWAAGLATVGVVLLAVFIAEPQRPQPAAPDGIPELQSAPAAPAAKKPMAAAPRAKKLVSAERDAEFAAETNAGAATARLEDAPGAVAPVPEERATQEALDELAEDLAHCAALLAAGEESRAREAYQRLRSGCPECDLPQTLEQALDLYPPAR